MTATELFPLKPSYAATNDDCEICHSDPTLTATRYGRSVSMYVDYDKFLKSVHKSLQCVHCHTDANVKEFPHPEKLLKVQCQSCHQQQGKDYDASIHHAALKRGSPYAPTCSTCHGVHYILPPDNPNSSTYIMNIPALCGQCHREGAPVSKVYKIPEKNILANYSMSIHGTGLFKMGLTVTATCNSCHRNHMILPATDPHSSISVQNIAKTCMKCHSRIEQVHKKIIRGALWEQQPGAVPACTDCHLPHKIQAVSVVPKTSDKSCLKCHAKKDLHKTVNGKTISLTVDVAQLQNSVHKNIPCVQCHSDISPHHPHPPVTVGKVNCANCHAEVTEKYFSSSHGQAYENKNKMAPYCSYCHGTHDVLSHLNEDAKTYRTHIPALCGDCHAKLKNSPNQQVRSHANVLFDYSRSVHGIGLVKLGLLPTAVCTDCHSTHYILGSNNPQSSVYFKNVPATCATCHLGIYKKFIKSIHSFTVTHTEKKLPVCNNCHSAHRIQNVALDPFMREVTEECGSCHKRLAKSYFETIHGQAYLDGNLNAAKCSDCHGAHYILSVNNPKSSVGIDNIVTTCRKCHPDADRRFTGYLTHATHHDRAKYPILFFTYWAMTGLLIGVFSFFGVHTILWLPRSYRHLKEKRKISTGPKRYYIRRFNTLQRLIHLFVILSFMALALTGMMLKFAGLPWAKFIASFVGGVSAAGTIHRIAAVITFGYFFTHLGSLLRLKSKKKLSLKQLIFGKNTMWFKKRDIIQFWQSMKWFVGLGPRPQYGRWTYWEKFDYFAVFWGVAVIGFTGLILWFPEFFTLFLPGWIINVAIIIHGDEALLAVGFIFSVHFFNSHLRPESFPLDPVIFTGLVPVEEYKEDRPAEYEDLKKSGELSKKVSFTEISPPKMLAIRIFGYTFLTIGIILIVSIIVSMLLGYK
ncbi:MAG: cytochrome c3 family protein [Calditrichia bacterium]